MFLNRELGHHTMFDDDEEEPGESPSGVLLNLSQVLSDNARKLERMARKSRRLKRTEQLEYDTARVSK